MMKQPNIFLILAEDICPNLGCYGDQNAKTPRLDAFAKDNIKFNYCYSCAPVCSAARTSLNLGMYASTAGVGQHRSYCELPSKIKNLGEYMQQAGYYTVIGKTDLNFPLNGGYDKELGFNFKDTEDFTKNIFKAYESKADNQPFMVMHTAGITHQSQYGFTEDTEAHRQSMPRLTDADKQDRDAVSTPDYHYNSKESREIWAQYHEKLTSFDRMFGEFIDELTARGLYEDSIVLFVGDNGHGIPSGKCNLWNEGVHVPMLLHIPKDMQHNFDLQQDDFGKFSTRLTSFVDFAPTLLSLAGADIPAHYQGTAFLGDKAAATQPTEVFSYSERVDEVFENSRSIHEHDLMYSCDFGLSPYRRLNVYQTTQAPWFVRSMIESGYEDNISDVDRRALYRQIPRVYEQMFNLRDDEASLTNLADDPKNKNEVLRLRDKMFTNIINMRDDALIAEPLLHDFMADTGLTAYEVLQEDKYYPVEKLAKLFIAGMDGKDFDVDVTNPCEKMLVTKFLADRNIANEKLLELTKDDNETVAAYAAFRINDVDVIEDICQKTSNYCLLLYIVDLIAVHRDGRYNRCFKIIVDRNWINDEFTHINDRYRAGMGSALNMLAVRFNKLLPKEVEEKLHWKESMVQNTYMVMNALDKK